MAMPLSSCGESTSSGTAAASYVEPIPGWTGAEEESSAKSSSPEEVPGDPIETTEDLVSSPDAPASYILLGDSRTVGMYWALSGDKSSETIQQLVNDSIVWDAKSGMGLAWMQEVGEPAMSSYVGEGTRICILMGVNDIGGNYTADDYILWLNEKADAWEEEGAVVFYALVNPVNESLRPETSTLSNDDIDAWNTEMEEGLSDSIRCIDLNSYLKDSGDSIVWKDWLHYEDATNLDLYRRLMTELASS